MFHFQGFPRLQIVLEHALDVSDQRREVLLALCRDVAVSACQIIDPAVRGVHVADSTFCKISDNTIRERRRESTMLAAVDVTGTSRNVLVQNNAVSEGTLGAIQCTDERGKVQGNVVWNALPSDSPS